MDTLTLRRTEEYLGMSKEKLKEALIAKRLHYIVNVFVVVIIIRKKYLQENLLCGV
jgi:hypothetical protein